MRKFYTALLFLLSFHFSYAQPASFHISNSLRFVDVNNDTIAYPFLGGFVAPQFSEIDLNNDGIKDLFVFDRSGNKKMTFLNEGKAGQVSYIYAPSYEYYFPEMVHWVLLRDYNCDGKEDIFTCSAPSGVSVYKNVSTGNKPAFELVEKDLKFEGMEIYSLSIDLPVFDDIDGDGDLDVLAFDIFGGYASFFRNERVEKGLDCDSLEFFQVDYCWGSFVEASLSNDVFLGDNCFGWKYYKSAAVHSGSTMLTFDADGDGDKDLLIGDVDFPDFKLLINGKVETGWPYDTVTSFTNNFPLNDKGVFIDKFPAAYYLDINNDGKKDFIASANEATAASNTHQNWWYKNIGQNNHPDFEFQDSSFLQDLTIDFGSRTQPVFFDVDGDGDLDLIVSHRGNWRITKNNRDQLALFENVGTSQRAVFKFITDDYLNFSTQNLAGISPAFADLNDDGKQDLILGLQNGRMRYYLNTGTLSSPAFTLQTDTFGSIDVGILSTPHFFDIDGDSVLDLIIGNNDGVIRYHKNYGTKTQPYFFPTPNVDTLGRIYTAPWFLKYDDYDNQGIPQDTSKVIEYDGMSAPWIADLDNDGNYEIITGGRTGEIQVYPLNLNNLADSVTQITDYFVNPHNQSKGIARFGARTTIATADLDGDGRLDMLIGNSRGGLHFLSSMFHQEDTLLLLDDPSLSADFKLFPNPSAGKFRLEMEGNIHGLASIEVLDMLGRKQMTDSWLLEDGGTKEMDLSRLSNGTYFIVIKHPAYQSKNIKVSILR